MKIAKLSYAFKRLFAALCLFSAGLAPAEAQAPSAVFSPPKHIVLNYEVARNGKPFAQVQEHFNVVGNTYKIESITKGMGFYALLGERRLISTGEVTPQGLKPNHFELHQGDNAKKSLFAEFDWANNVLKMQVKGKPVEAKLLAGTQDLASYAYQFMFLPRPFNEALLVNLTTGKRLNQYPYQVNTTAETTISATGISYKSLHLTQQPDKSQTSDKPQSESKELWLAAEYYYLPVRILMVDDNGAKIEQTISDMVVE